MIAVRDRLDELRPALPVVVTFADDLRRLEQYRSHLALPFPIVADPARSLYHLLGAGRGSLAQVWSPGTIATYVRLVARGRRLRLPTQDTRQLGADVVVDAEGRLRRVWLPPHPDARPTVADLAGAIRALGSS